MFSLAASKFEVPNKDEDAVWRWPRMKIESNLRKKKKDRASVAIVTPGVA